MQAEEELAQLRCGSTGVQLREMFVLPDESCTYDFLERYR